MYCPKCALEATEDQKFCRSCGFSLRQVAEMMAARDEKLSDKKKIVLDAVGSALIIIALVAGGIVSEIENMPYIARSIIESVAWFMAMTGVGLLCYLAGLKKGADSRRPAKSDTTQLSEPADELLPDSYGEPIPSVTERTTEFIKPEGERNSELRYGNKSKA